MRKIFLILLISTICTTLWAQSGVTIVQDPVIEQIQNSYIKAWNKVGETNGYRIQIVAVSGTNSKNTAESERSTFLNTFPEIPTYLSYAEPYFRIRIGDFKTRLEAYKTLVEIQVFYPNAYIVPDKIQYLEK